MHRNDHLQGEHMAEGASPAELPVFHLQGSSPASGEQLAAKTSREMQREKLENQRQLLLLWVFLVFFPVPI